MAEDDIDAHSIAKAIERTGLEVSLSDSATSRNFILRKDTKKKKIKFEEIDESEWFSVWTKLVMGIIYLSIVHNTRKAVL